MEVRPRGPASARSCLALTPSRVRLPAARVTDELAARFLGLSLDWIEFCSVVINGLLGAV